MKKISGGSNTIQEPADEEDEVRAMLTSYFFNEINLLAREAKLPVRLKGGGGRMSFTDGVGYVKEVRLMWPTMPCMPCTRWLIYWQASVNDVLWCNPLSA